MVRDLIHEMIKKFNSDFVLENSLYNNRGNMDTPLVPNPLSSCDRLYSSDRLESRYTD